MGAVMDRRAFLRGGAAALVASPWVLRAAPPLTPVTVHVDAATTIRQLPLIMAHHLGFFREAGLDVQLALAPFEASALDELARWPATLFAGTFERTLYLHALGEQHRAFAVMASSPQMVLGTSRLHSVAGVQVADLRGARIGVEALGSLSHRLARWVLLRHGVAAHEVSFVPMASATQAMAALNSGAVSALCCRDPVATLLDTSGMLRVLADTRSPRDTQAIFGGAVAFNCLSAPVAYLAAQPQIAQQLTDALAKSLAWLRNATPNDWVRHAPDSIMNPNRALFIEMVERTRGAWARDLSMPPQAPERVWGAMQQLDLPVRLDGVRPESTYTNRFAARTPPVARV